VGAIPEKIYVTSENGNSHANINGQEKLIPATT
jgi:hypothetical protein